MTFSSEFAYNFRRPGVGSFTVYLRGLHIRSKIGYAEKVFILLYGISFFIGFIVLTPRKSKSGCKKNQQR